MDVHNYNGKIITNDDISLKEVVIKGKEWFDHLLSKWKLILIVSSLGAFLGLTYSFISKPLYKANLSFVIEDDKAGGGLSSAMGLASTFGIDLGGGGGSMFSSANLIELFKSRSMVEKALLSNVSLDGSKITLAEMYIQSHGWRDKWNENPELKLLTFETSKDQKQTIRAKDSILGVIYNDLSKNCLNVEQKDIKVSIININMSSNDELFAKLFTEGLVRQVSNFYIETKSKKSRENMLILQRQTDSIRGALNGAITGVAVANDNTFNLNPAFNVKRAPSARKQVDVQANTAILTELVKQTELAKVTLRKETPLIQIIDKPILPLERDKLGPIKGFVIGGFLSTFLISLFLILRRSLK
ncbi:Wzz/FepE/Etk N-terminal domain-containing protein [Flavobacterium sp. 14A]|uniref:Wzz/FepE/Etk N-terminal domain-containing protein n=1 Tax=Flavobacterium sp. 14A TaxID=2735896 RepID=UPI001570280E|nr:Wzz/FepE/Etk N-terminal domain-containing protein [Flavobacterium sp. 14A]NRT10961.1 uncharacterized protein involved in exopolysaccharide biosynthesis [Flavobacterium sp. 14A]